MGQAERAPERRGENNAQRDKNSDEGGVQTKKTRHESPLRHSVAPLVLT